MREKFRIIDLAKSISLGLMAVYFVSVMIFSDRLEYVKISNMLFVAFAGMVGGYRLVSMEIKNSRFYYYIFAILFLSVMSYYWAYSPKTVLSTTRTYFNLTLLAVAMINIIETKEELIFALKAFGISGVIMCVYTIFVYGFDTFITMMKDGERLGAAVSQENTFGLFCLMSFVVLISIAIFDKKKLYYILSAIPFICGFASGSRKVLVGIVITFAIIIILNTTSKKIISTVIISTVIIYILTLMASSEYFAVTFERFNMFRDIFDQSGGGQQADHSSKMRMDMILMGLKWFTQKPIFGHGTYQYNSLFEKAYGVYTYSHNFYIQQLVSFGVVGFLLFMGMYYEIIKHVWMFLKKNTDAKILFIFVVIMVINGFAAEYSASKLYFMILGFGFSFINVYHKKSFKYRGRKKISKFNRRSR